MKEEEVKALEVARTEELDPSRVEERSYSFRPRGVGMDGTSGCIVCGGQAGMRANIAAFVESKEDGEAVVALFGRGARLDHRQVKIGACASHVSVLYKLLRVTGSSISLSKILSCTVPRSIEMNGRSPPISDWRSFGPIEWDKICDSCVGKRCTRAAITVNQHGKNLDGNDCAMAGETL
jgi:hypothetical protein